MGLLLLFGISRYWLLPRLPVRHLDRSRYQHLLCDELIGSRTITDGTTVYRIVRNSISPESTQVGIRTFRATLRHWVRLRVPLLHIPYSRGVSLFHRELRSMIATMMLGTRTRLILISLYAASSTPFTRLPVSHQRTLSRLLFSNSSYTRVPAKDVRYNVVLQMRMGIFTIQPRIGVAVAAAETKPVMTSENNITTMKKEMIWKDQQADISPSVHLKLGSEAMMPTLEESKTLPQTTKRDQAILHTYKHSDMEPVSGLNVAKEKFEHWLCHCLPLGTIIDPLDITTQDISVVAIRQDLRNLWKARRLLCDRTELLTVYQSDLTMTATHPPLEKRGGFTDLLHLYAERHVGIVQDEIEDDSNTLLQWLHTEYPATQQLLATNFHSQSKETQRLVLQSFLDWFRSNFPYYYDKCHKCGASCKQDGEDEGGFLGYVYPENHEVAGKAGRTELYQCHKCQAITRFPRFNAASHVLQQKRGRCGEYSMLMYRMLRATGHETRWIVDWAASQGSK